MSVPVLYDYPLDSVLSSTTLVEVLLQPGDRACCGASIGTVGIWFLVGGEPLKPHALHTNYVICCGTW
jgi:hypothetical protein